jgi:hypothetical protein
MTSEQSVVVRVADALKACEIDYMLSGSFASNMYGIPRSTRDADFVLQCRGGVGEEFCERLGDGFEFDPQLAFETVTGTYKQLLKQKGSAFQVELFQLSSDPHDQMRFTRRRPAELFGRRLWFATAEDVIVTKLRWARTKDKDDARDVMSVQRGKLDWPYIEEWCRRHGSLELMEEIRRSVPEI